MNFTIQTVVILVVILIMAVILLGLVTSWGNTGKGLFESFFSWLSGVKGA